MLTVGNLNILSNWSGHLAAFFPGIDSMFSTQGIMVMLLGTYAFAMWMFLSNAPKVHTIMVSDLEIARQFYEGFLKLSVAQVPLHYYYNYEQTLGTAGVDPMYLSSPNSANIKYRGSEGLWYQLKKNTQLHIIAGANLGENDRQRHVCFDSKCLEAILLKVQSRRLKYKIRREKPLNFLVKDLEDRVIELAEVSN
ncbi:MAG: glyoxalase-like domain protein [Cyanobacteriota bacterium ELA615]|jgi:hypothetical protein